jgi:ABC-type Na+ efflux pump permease subunit
MRFHQVRTLARNTLLEAVRTHLPWLVLLVLLLVIAGSFFVEQLAITESARMRIGFVAAATRSAMVFVLTLHVLSSMVREFNDKGLELVLSIDLRRSDYILGRVLGYQMLAFAMAVAAVLPLLLQAPALAVLEWGVSLALELAVVAALAVFCSVTFTQIMGGASFVLGAYLLARTLDAIRLISAAPIGVADSPSHQVFKLVVDGLALIVPALDRVTQSAWLTDAMAPWPAVGAFLWQAVLYTTLLTVAAMFDLYRRNL